jgi:3-oxoacyl-(acyl-carrier-protein) synthase
MEFRMKFVEFGALKFGAGAVTAVFTAVALTHEGEPHTEQLHQVDPLPDRIIVVTTASAGTTSMTKTTLLLDQPRKLTLPSA